MFLGHFGVAFAAKRAAPKTSLGFLVFAAQFADLLWPILLLFGVEKVRIVPGLLAASPFDFTRYPISHSLVAQLGWGALVGLICFSIHRDGKSALLLGSLVPTHWVLDFVAHRPDMPIYRGGPKYGLGMWNSIPLTISVEYVLFAAGIALYLSKTHAKDATGKWGGLNRSVQHLLAVYLPEFEIPKFFLDADLSATPPHRARLENTLTSLFS